MSGRTRIAWVALVVVAVGAGPMVQAQPEVKTKPAAVADVSREDETHALAFASRHHPELADLLTPMKASHPKEYQRALRELFRVSDRLTRLESRQPERYAIELDLWKTESRLRLVAAKSAMLDDEERRQQIETLVTERNSLRIRLYEFERAELEQRIAQLTKQIDSVKAQQSEGVAKEVDRLVNSAKSSAKRVNARPGKPAEFVSPPGKPKSENSKRAPGAGGASQ
jgi:uncharacterized small protein (DUF1192 family)